MHHPGPYEIDGESEARDWGASLEIISGDVAIARVLGLSYFAPIKRDEFALMQSRVLATARLFREAPNLLAICEKLLVAEKKFMANEDELYPHDIMDLLDEVAVILARLKKGGSGG